MSAEEMLILLLYLTPRRERKLNLVGMCYEYGLWYCFMFIYTDAACSTTYKLNIMVCCIIYCFFDTVNCTIHWYNAHVHINI